MKLKIFITIFIVLASMGCREQKLSNGIARCSTSASLAWDYPDTPVVDGFRVYYGNKAGGPYDVGNLTVNDSKTTSIANLPQGVYYFVATAYQGANESPYSNEAVKCLVDSPVTAVLKLDSRKVSGRSAGSSVALSLVQ